MTFQRTIQFAVWCGIASFLTSALYAERLPVKTYTVADGLLRDHVYRIRQDSRGFLWFCTNEGLSRFDGVGMTNFTGADGLPDREVGDFLETKNGIIYIATGKGLARLNPYGLRGSTDNPLFTVIKPDNASAEKIVILYEGNNGQVWVGTSDGLYKLTETDGVIALEAVPLGRPLPGVGGAIFVPSPNALYVDAIVEDRNGMLWIGTFGGGLFRLSQDGSLRRFYAPNDFGDNKITALLEDREGRLWMGMRSDEKGGVCLLDTTAEEDPVRKCYTEKDGLGSNRIRDILQTSDGQVWLATTPGLCRWKGDDGQAVCKTYTVKNDLCNDIFTLAEDKDGNLWTGSPCGAKKIARYGFTAYNETDGLNYNQVTSVFENSAGKLIVITFPKTERVVSRFDGDKFTSIKVSLPDDVDFHGWGWQQTVWQDGHGAWWIPSGYGLFRSPDNTSFENLAKVRLEKQETGARSGGIFRLFEDSRGDIWIATTDYANEILRWERAANAWHDHTWEAGITASRVGTAFVEDRHGNVWIGASSDHNDGALIRYRNGEFRVFTQAEGAPSGWTSDLFLDSRGRLWIATNQNGLLRLDDTNSDKPEFVRYTPADGLTGVASNCVTEDEFGRIYIGTWRGVDRLNPDTGQIENFSTADGLPSSYIQSSYRDGKNNLWFTTEKGLARFVPEPPRVRQPPNILITSLRVNGEPQNISVLGETEIPSLDLSSDQRQVSLDFIGLGATLGEKLRYEYRLTGGDWTQTNERTINFANLASGNYSFEIRAVTADRIYSERAASLGFTIFPPIWQRWWFVFSVLVVATGLVYAFYRYRVDKLVEIERTRTRIATDLHDDIGSNLSKISLLSDIVNMQMTNGNSESRRMLTTIAEVSRSSVAAMRDIVWAINPQRDSVLEVTRKMREYAEETFVPRNVAVRFDTPAGGDNLRLSMDVRRELFLIFKEAINNAVRHSGCSSFEIDFRIRQSEITLQISDDGRGFDASRDFDGNGLPNMKTRAEKIGGQFEVNSSGERGTTIKIRVPK